MKKGKFIVVDGNNGCGKSTLINHAKEVFGTDIFTFSREPGGSVLGEKIREVMLSEEARQADGHTQFGLIWSSRADHLKNTIVPTIEQGRHLLSDRFDSSTYAYQIHAQQSADLKDLFFQVRDVFVGKNTPDLYIILDVSAEEGMKRMSKRVRDENSHFHDQEIEYYNRIRTGYLEYANYVRSKIINTEKPLEEVKAEFINIIKEVLNEN